MADTLTARANRAAADRARPAVTGETALYALRMAQERQRLREGRVDAVERALAASDLLRPSEGVSPPVVSRPDTLPSIRWFVAQVKPGAEGVATRALSDGGFCACAPTVGYWVTRNRQERVRVAYVFPRYAFVGLVPDARGDVDFRSPRLCDGVSGFVEGAGRRVEVRDDAVGDLMMTSEMGWLDLVHERVMRPMPKRLRSADFLRTMSEVMAADAGGRMRLFLQHFGERRGLSERVACGMCDATD